MPASRRFPAEALTTGQAFVAYDRILDAAQTGPTWLRRPEIASIIADAIHRGQADLHHYEIHAYAVMANHVHLLITPEVSLPRLLQSLKGATSRRANELLGLAGTPFWAEETFDRTIRNRQEFSRITTYIENNPVRAGIVRCAEDFRWSSAWKAGSQCSLTGHT